MVAVLFASSPARRLRLGGQPNAMYKAVRRCYAAIKTATGLQRVIRSVMRQVIRQQAIQTPLRLQSTWLPRRLLLLALWRVGSLLLERSLRAFAHMPREVRLRSECRCIFS
jgi:hypothetical protein